MTDSKPLAVVTGASSGIGRELARQFATNGFDVIAAAEDSGLVAAVDDLATTGAEVQPVRADLATFGGVEQLLEAIAATGREVDAVALNAGIGNGGAFLDVPLADEERLIDLNIGATVHLAKWILPGMVARGAGRLLFTSSVASQMPGPYYAPYAASKAFIQSFAQALRYELGDTGVTVTALLPGPTDSEFFERAGMEGTPVDSSAKDDPADVARDGFEALMAGKSQVVAGSAKNKIQAAAAKLLPDQARAATHAKMTKPEESERMRALTWQGNEQVEVTDVPDPVIQEPNDIIIRVTSTAICGSDLHLYGVLGPFLKPGDVLGHEPMGIVEETGPDINVAYIR